RSRERRSSAASVSLACWILRLVIRSTSPSTATVTLVFSKCPKDESTALAHRATPCYSRSPDRAGGRWRAHERRWPPRGAASAPSSGRVADRREGQGPPPP